MYLNTTQTAERLGISKGKVKKLIEDGKLISLPTSDGKRKYYKVDEKAVIAFKREMRNTPMVSTSTKANRIPDGFVDSEEAARLCGVAVNTMWGRLRNGKVQAMKVGGRTFFKKDSLMPSNKKEVTIIASSVTLGLGSRLTRIEEDIVTLKEQLTNLVKELGGL